MARTVIVHCFSFDDVAIVHLAKSDSETTLCGKKRMRRNLTRRKITCTECRERSRKKA